MGHYTLVIVKVAGTLLLLLPTLVVNVDTYSFFILILNIYISIITLHYMYITLQHYTLLFLVEACTYYILHTHANA